MRSFIAAAFAVLAAIGAPSATAAEKNPFELKASKYNLGMVIVAIDDAPPGWDAAKPAPLNWSLNIDWFDPVQKKPHVELHWVSSPNAAEFRTVTDEAGHRYLVGPIGEGEAMIVSYYTQAQWGMCYNAETYHFYVKGGTYNFIGRFDQKPSHLAISQAVMAHKMPAYVSQNGYITPLVDRTIDGFTPGDSLPDDKARVEALAAKQLGHPVDIVTPALVKTDYNLSKNAFGSTSCAFWSGKEDRPDRSAPAVEPTPASATPPEAAAPSSSAAQ